jgi:hypothetical protein
MGRWRDDANHCRSNCTHSHLICRRFRFMSALLLCADFARTDPVSALCPTSDIAPIRSPRRRGQAVSHEHAWAIGIGCELSASNRPASRRSRKSPGLTRAGFMSRPPWWKPPLQSFSAVFSTLFAERTVGQNRCITPAITGAMEITRNSHEHSQCDYQRPAGHEDQD